MRGPEGPEGPCVAAPRGQGSALVEMGGGRENKPMRCAHTLSPLSLARARGAAHAHAHTGVMWRESSRSVVSGAPGVVLVGLRARPAGRRKKKKKSKGNGNATLGRRVSFPIPQLRESAGLLTAALGPPPSTRREIPNAAPPGRRRPVLSRAQRGRAGLAGRQYCRARLAPLALTTRRRPGLAHLGSPHCGRGGHAPGWRPGRPPGGRGRGGGRVGSRSRSSSA